jgi:hypothetical protein
MYDMSHPGLVETVPQAVQLLPYSLALVIGLAGLRQAALRFPLVRNRIA